MMKCGMHVISIGCGKNVCAAFQLCAIIWFGISDSCLVNIACLGHVAPLPKYASNKVRQMTDLQGMSPYMELGTAYSIHSIEKLRRSIDQHAQTFTTVSVDRHINPISNSRQCSCSFVASMLNACTSRLMFY